MVRWTEDAVRRATNLMETAAWQVSIEVVCRYGVIVRLSIHMACGGGSNSGAATTASRQPCFGSGAGSAKNIWASAYDRQG